MEKFNTGLPGVYRLQPVVFGDDRGYFVETYNRDMFASLGIHNVFVQDNQSFTQKKHTLRGIHFQKNPMAQAKLVRAMQGAVMDVVVDLRKESPNYLMWTAIELSGENKQMLFIPPGFGHGFITLTDNVVFCYKVDAFYSKECDRSIRYDDPQIGVDWNVLHPILSGKDENAPFLKDSDCNFIYEG
ncbi:MAG: dTDP-4-dehydrorhamnose 3,5-epimerase [Clostridiales bacterium]|nr:dTDP-4-dehydrorhamnose 3,5-epimerase [Clostridiales bacterium]